MKNKTKHGLVTGLTALSTAMICQTSMTYASDIEIYKAPTTGGAIIQLILDMSTSMQTPVNNSGGYLNPINKDFRISCETGRNTGNSSTYGATRKGISYSQTDKRYFTDSEVTPTTYEYSFTGRYCNVQESDVDTWSTGSNTANKAKASLIKNSCELFTSGPTKYYRCPDRLTSLKHSIFDLIIGTPDVQRLPDTAYIGITTFPTTNILTPVLLNDAGRKKILDHVDGLTTSNGTPISQGYTNATKTLLDFTQNNNAATSCAGFGLYFLTDGEPLQDNRGTAQNTVNPYLKTGHRITNSQCSGSISLTENDKNKQALSWSCVEPIAKKLQEKHNTRNLEIKTAVVGFGGDFSFKDSLGEPIQFTTTMTETQAADLFSGPIQKAAARAATAGKGGWFSADNSADIVNSVQNFVESIKVPIPAITTGTAAIPQDYLNPIELQSYAYFPQFQPKPSEDFEAWFGNLKKFSVKDGVLVGQDNDKVFGADGALKSSTKDFWVNGASADWAVYGGLLSKLNLQTFTNGTDFARAVYTNAGGSIEKVNLKYMQEKIATGNNKYLLGALGYDLTETELDELAALDSLELTNLANREQNRSIGAIMHSTPVLLTQSGKITYSDTKKSNETVDRNDYILFGTTQGALHVVKTGREADTYGAGLAPATYEGGKEIFTFIPAEMLSAQPKGLLSETNTDGDGMEKLYYGIDGAWTAHTEYVYNKSLDKFEVNPTSGKKGKQWVYGGMRMGGSSYYALDLTDIDSPTVKFRIDPAAKTISDVDGNGDPIEGTERTVGYVYKNGSTTGTPYTDLAKMGQSWSKPTIAYVQWKGQRKLVMIVGGGYDPEYEDFRTGKSAKGAGVYMFDADTGDLLWTTYDASGGDEDNLEYSVVSQIKAVDREGDGDVDHLYFGDLGGQVFRIDLKSDHASSDSKTDFGKVTRLANFKETGKYAPRFYEMPAFSIYRNATGIFAVLSIGSGNRSTPLLGKVIDSQYVTPDESDTENQKLLNDAIYNIYDLAVTDKNPANSTKGPLSIGRSNLQQITDEDRELASDEDQAGEDYNENSSYKGWYYEFPSSASIGNRKAVEKVQSDLVLLDSDLYVSTFDAEGVGSEEACGAGIYGSSRAHRFCMPYGQCGAGDTVEDNTMTLGKGLLGITLGQSTDANGVPYRSIIGPVENRNPTSNKILNTLYRNKIKLTPYSWYERN